MWRSSSPSQLLLLLVVVVVVVVVVIVVVDRQLKLNQAQCAASAGRVGEIPDERQSHQDFPTSHLAALAILNMSFLN